MSLPVTAAERAQFLETQGQARPAENVVSTACPQCGVRFALVAHLDAGGWNLRCTLCGYSGKGSLK